MDKYQTARNPCIIRLSPDQLREEMGSILPILIAKMTILGLKTSILGIQINKFQVDSVARP